MLETDTTRPLEGRNVETVRDAFKRRLSFYSCRRGLTAPENQTQEHLTPMTPEEQKQHNARNGAQPHVQQTTDFLSSDIELEVGLKLLSRAEFSAWREENKEPLGAMIRSEIYKPESIKSSEAFKRDAAKKGIEFVDNNTVDWKSSPQGWEIESWRTDSKNGGKTLCVIRKPRDAYSYDRQHCTRADLENNFTTQTLAELIDRHYESTKSVWAAKSVTVRERDIAQASTKIRNEARDEIGAAANVVATFDAMTGAEKAVAFRDVAYRGRYMGAKNLIESVRNFK